MAKDTGIAWATSTFNPWMGCTAISPACDHCYADARMDKRLHVVKWGAGEPRKRTSAANWREPLKWDAERARAIAAGENPPPHRVFCASLADVFDNEVPDEWRADLFALIRATPNLTWMLLTKRIGNANKMMAIAMMLQIEMLEAASSWPWPNVWIGATICNQEEADRDIPKLLALPAAVRFVSIEPMLGAITLPGFNATTSWCPICKAIVRDGLFAPHENAHGAVLKLTEFNPSVHCQGVETMLNWVICGGESGKDARPMHPDWARSLRDQCASAGVPFFFKQWGEWTPRGPTSWGYPLVEDVPRKRITRAARNGQDLSNAQDDGDVWMQRVGTKAAGNLLDGKTWMQFPDEEKK